MALLTIFSVFFFNDPATTEIYTLSLHDALPIYRALTSGAYGPQSVEHTGVDRILILYQISLGGCQTDLAGTQGVALSLALQGQVEGQTRRPEIGRAHV